MQNSPELKITSHYEVDGRIYFGINNCLRIVKNLGQPDLIAAFEFQQSLDSITVSPCGKFLLACTQNGEIFIRDLSVVHEEKNESNVNGEQKENEDASINDEKSIMYDVPTIFQE